MADYGIFRSGDAKRIAAATRRVEGTPRQYIRVPEQISRRYGGGGCSCLNVHEIKIEGSATGGTFTLDVTVKDNSGTTTTATTSTIARNATAATVQTAYEGLAAIVSGDVEVRGGPLPNTAVYVVFERSGNFSRYHQDPPVPDSTSLTGTNPICKAAQVTSVNWEG